MSAERRYLVRSTKTKELGAAHQFALSIYSEAEILKKHNGTAKLRAPTFEAVAKQYLVDLEERVDLGLETKSRLHNARYGMKVWIRYIGEKKLTQNTEEDVELYAPWRIKTRPQKKIQKTTIPLEYAVYRQIMKFAIKKKYIRTEQINNISYRFGKNRNRKTAQLREGRNK